ncbi:MAG: NCS2 family permease [bacterium]|nr:NCS2 family permease [bacterium]
MAARYPWFVKRDLDGFFGLFVDNIVQLLVITELGVAIAGLSRAFVYARILPGAALSILVGNLYYSWQARRIALREGRDDITALPYGINTPSVFAYLFFVMGPIFSHHKAQLGADGAALLAWQAGLAACLGSGLIEFFGAFAANTVRRITPRAALLGALAGIAIGFISMDFTLQVFERPLLALLPAGIILIQYFSGVRLPLGLPAGLVALLVGTVLAWTLKAFTLTPLFAHLGAGVQSEIGLELATLPSAEAIKAALQPAMHLPIPSMRALMLGLTQPEILGMMGVIVPMGLFNVIGSLQNIESAEAAGDRFPTAPSLAVNGIGSIAAACFGSCFPTTIYIGHAGWKRLGARTGYSVINGVVISLLCFSGLISAFSALIPMQAVIGILIWIAVIIGAQAFQAVPRRHALAVVLGLFPALASWGLLTFQRGLQSAGMLDPGVLSQMNPAAHVGGMIGLDRGFILTSMGWAAMGVAFIDRRFRVGAGWALTLAALSFFGIVHAWNPGNLGESFTLGFGVGWRYAVPYLGLAIILMLLAPRAKPLTDVEASDGYIPDGH